MPRLAQNADISSGMISSIVINKKQTAEPQTAKNAKSNAAPSIDKIIATFGNVTIAIMKRLTKLAPNNVALTTLKKDLSMNKIDVPQKNKPCRHGLKQKPSKENLNALLNTDNGLMKLLASPMTLITLSPYKAILSVAFMCHGI